MRGRCRILELWPDASILVNESNRGFGPAANQAAEGAPGDVLLFLNPDTRAEGDPFSEIARAFDAHPGAAAIAPRLLDFDAPQSEIQNPKSKIVPRPLAPPGREDQFTFQLRRLPDTRQRRPGASPARSRCPEQSGPPALPIRGRGPGGSLRRRAGRRRGAGRSQGPLPAIGRLRFPVRPGLVRGRGSLRPARPRRADPLLAPTRAFATAAAEPRSRSATRASFRSITATPFSTAAFTTLCRPGSSIAPSSPPECSCASSRSHFAASVPRPRGESARAYLSTLFVALGLGPRQSPITNHQSQIAAPHA